MKNIHKVLYAVSVVAVHASLAQAQDYPPNAEPGKCYAKCVIPDQYETVTEEVLIKQATQRIEIIPAQFQSIDESVEVKPASTRIEVIPALFETVDERIEIKPASVRLEPVAAQFQEVEEKIMVKPAEIKLVEVPAQYETVTEQIEVAPASTKWVKRKGDANCLSANPDDCLVWCLVEVPAQYETVTKTVMKTPPTTKEVTVPAEYKSVKKTVMVKAAETRTVEVPAEFKTVSNRRLVKPGGYTDWREVLCQNKINSVKIKEIQAALKAKGYDPGAIDDQMGAKTKAALVQFQKDKGLPVGQLDFETLKALGVSY